MEEEEKKDDEEDEEEKVKDLNFFVATDWSL